jgi:hypothetical protein
MRPFSISSLRSEIVQFPSETVFGFAEESYVHSPAWRENDAIRAERTLANTLALIIT